MHLLNFLADTDVTLITSATTAIGAIVAAAVLAYTAAMAWPVAQKVYRVAKQALRGA